jgi:hypothetical protein
MGEVAECSDAGEGVFLTLTQLTMFADLSPWER